MSTTPTPQLNEMDSRTPWQKTGIKSLQLLAADMTGNITELVFLKYRDELDRAVPALRKAFHALFCEPVRWMQKPLEKMLDHTQNFEGQEEHDRRLAKSEQERLEGLVDASYDYLSAAVVGAAALMGTERGLSKLMKTDHFSKKMWAIDAGMHVGTVVFMGTPMMKDHTRNVNKFFENVMVASGWKPEEAKQDARFATVYILPNYVNWFTTSTIAGAQYHGVWDKLKNLFTQVNAKANQPSHAVAM